MPRPPRTTLPAFSRTARYVAAREFELGTRTFRPGDPFDAEVSDRKRRVLYEARYLRPAPEVVHRSPRHAVHRGGGWYDVIGPSGERLNERGLRKGAAEELAAG